MEKENTENKEKLERDKDLKRKNKFGSFIELLVKQMCRRATYEIEAAKFSNSVYSLNECGSIMFSAKNIKAMHDNTKEGLVSFLSIKLFDEETVQNVYGGNWLSNDNFSRDQKHTLLRYLTTISHMAPVSAQKWNDLQHYLHYIYRNFASPYPDLAGEQISPAFKNHMRELFTSLLQEDESQLYLRMLALLREYCIFAHWHYCNHEDEHNVTRLFYYYEAMLSAAKKIGSIFTEFENVLRKNYSVFWIDFNTAVFLRYFFRTDMVQIKLRRAVAIGSNPGDTQGMFQMLDDLRNLWVKEEIRLKKINDEAAIKETVDYYYIEEAMINSHKKVLTWNFWIDRPQKDKNDLDLRRLDHHIFRLLADPSFCPAGPMLDRSGQCICEECTLAKYKYILGVEDKLVEDREVKKFARLTFCRLCEGPVHLEKFHEHLNIHFTEKTGPHDIVDPTNLTRLFSGKLSMNYDHSNSPYAAKGKRNPDHPERSFTCEVHSGKLNIDNSYLDCLDCNDIARMEIEHFLRKRKDTGPLDTIRLNSSIRTYLRIKHGLFKETDKLVKANQPKIHTESDRKNREMRKSAHKHEKPSLSSHKLATATTSKGSWENSCKHEEEDKFGTCEDDMCDHQKENSKCDCTFCEMFGTSMSCQSYKHNELKEKLRIRLHQRREKRTKDVVKNPPPAVVGVSNNIATNVKMKTVINKVEERVPLPSSPTNIPPAPVVKSSESSVTSSGTDDIHGLVNYIEGGFGLNKIVRAQKKAAKKARQRQKKEEERMKIEEQKRLAEELKRMEEEKKELAKKIVEKENQVKTDSQVLKAQLKKAKKERQAEKKKQLEEKGYTSVFEETIPAMVTIKRIAENGNNPTVTITLKGATPDQDKLLYALVMDAEVHNSKDSKETENANNGSKNKKKQKKQNNSIVQPPEPSPKVITKELKVTVSLDSNAKTNHDIKKNKTTNKNIDNKKPTTNNNKPKEVNTELKENELPMPMLRLPPGITITKVEGPVSKRSYKVNEMEEQKDSTINVGKSGVIVVDTEKLIQNKQSQPAAAADQKPKTGKKTKRKKKKQTESQVASGSGKKMITLKNPIFHALQTKPPEPIPIEKSNDSCAPAAIFTNENGMVTIRSSRLQQSLSNSTTMPLMSLSNFLPEIKKQQSANACTTTEQENNEISHFNAQEILSGLPGIEITKVDKFTDKPQFDLDKACQTAQVSIIPASNGVEKREEKDDWHYDNVFTPRDDLEDEMDDDELELEAFKRFCQQSVPPKRKEKVAHLNVADIILKKKPDNFV